MHNKLFRTSQITQDKYCILEQLITFYLFSMHSAQIYIVNHL